METDSWAIVELIISTWRWGTASTLSVYNRLSNLGLYAINTYARRSLGQAMFPMELFSNQNDYIGRI